jgi:hypothetical protein
MTNRIEGLCVIGFADIAKGWEADMTPAGTRQGWSGLAGILLPVPAVPSATALVIPDGGE